MIAPALLLLALSGSTPQATDTATMAYDAAGVRVIQRVNPATAVVAARLYLLGGTRQLTPATAGIEALLLAASAHGTAAYPGDTAIRAMGRTGSFVLLDPGADWTTFGFVGLAREFTASWTVLADRLMHPTLSDGAVTRAREELLGAAQRRYADPDERIQVLANRARFEGHPYALDPEGTDVSLRALTAADLQRYLHDEIVRSRLLLVVVGGVTRNEVESAVTRTLAGLPAGAYRWTLPPPAPDLQPRWVTEARALPTNYLLGYFVGPPPQAEDYPAFVLATQLLSAKVSELIRQRLGLSYASYAPFIERAVPIGGIYATTTKPEVIVPLVEAEIRLLSTQPFNPYAIAEFERSLLRGRLLGATTSDAQADLLARAELYYGDWRLAGPNLQRIKGVSSARITAAAQKYMRRISMAYIGDTTRMAGSW